MFNIDLSRSKTKITVVAISLVIVILLGILLFFGFNSPDPRIQGGSILLGALIIIGLSIAVMVYLMNYDPDAEKKKGKKVKSH